MNDPSLKEIIIISKHFYPEVTSTGQLLTELAEALKKSGYNPQAITVTIPGPNQPVDYQGIPISRTRNTSFPKKNTLGRLVNDLSFLLGVFMKLCFFDRTAIVLVVSNPPFLPLIGWLFKRIRGMRFVYLVHDVYPEIAINLGYLKKNGIIAKIWNIFNRLIIKEASATIVLGSCMKEIVGAKVKPGQGNIMIIPNWCDEQLIKPIEKENNQFIAEQRLSDKFIVLYSGNLGLFQNLEVIIHVAESLADYRDILFLFIGEGGKKEKLVELVNEIGLSNVRFLPYQEKGRMSESYSAADVHIITLEKGAEGLGVPSKLYTILASGRPIIALLGNECEVAQVIADAKCGYVLDQDNSEEFCNMILRLYNSRQLGKIMGKNARECFEKDYTKSIIMDRYLDLFGRLCNYVS